MSDLENFVNQSGRDQGVKDVRIGRQVIIELDETDEAKAKAEVEAMCEKLLANTVIENYDITIEA